MSRRFAAPDTAARTRHVLSPMRWLLELLRLLLPRRDRPHGMVRPWALSVPVLVLRPDAPRDFGRVALVAWKGSPEAARAVHDALPFLQTAERVVLCAVGERSAA